MEENQTKTEHPGYSGIVDHRRIEDQSRTIGKISFALSKAQGELQGAAKNAKGHFNNTYADLHAVIESCKNILSKHEIAFVQGNRFKNGIFLVVTKLIHSSGEWLSSEMALPVPKNANPQQIGSLNTYGRRYGLASMAGVAQYDDDANLSSGIKTQQVTK
jgi:hypothetical protein